MHEVPIHPILVHIPIALAVLMPLIFGGLIIAIRRDFLPVQSWWIAVLLQLVLALGSIAALGSGHAEEERVEDFVPKEMIESHEHLAMAMAGTALVALVLSAASLRKGIKGERLYRVASFAASLAVLGLAGMVGHQGGELVYKHGAAGIAQPTQLSNPPAPEEEENPDHP